jgi:hypothetical protein
MCPDDENINDIDDTIDEPTTPTDDISDDTPSTDPTPTPTPTPTLAYCTKDEVNSLFGDISDDITDEMFTTVIDNSTAWVNSNLKRSRVPVPLIVPDNATEIVVEIQEDNGLYLTDESDIKTLRTAAIYYAASDVLLSLYHGEELPIQYDVWFRKAQEFLDAYIEAYWNSDADEDDMLNHQMVKHSRALSYNEKRCRRTRL